MKAYSLDLRERIVSAVKGGQDKIEVARLFRVGLATVNRYLKLERHAGSLRAEPIPGRPRAIRLDDHAALAAQVEAHNDATLERHAELWASATGGRVSAKTMGRALTRAKLTRKKDAVGERT